MSHTVSSVVKAVTGAVGDVVDTAGDVVEGVGHAVGETADFVGDAVGDTVGFLGDTVSTLVTGVKAIFGGIDMPKTIRSTILHWRQSEGTFAIVFDQRIQRRIAFFKLPIIKFRRFRRMSARDHFICRVYLSGVLIEMKRTNPGTT